MQNTSHAVIASEIVAQRQPRMARQSIGVRVMAWSNELVADLKRMWEAGDSCAIIADALGHGISRNAVIGKIHRLGLSGRITVARRAQARPGPIYFRARQAFVPRIEKPKTFRVSKLTGLPKLKRKCDDRPKRSESAAMVIVVAPALDSNVTIMDLRETMCRWPIGDPRAEEFRYCGSDKGGHQSYCAFHARMAYQPPQERGARTAPTRREMAAA